MKFDTVIIGGGLSGLVCGIRLSQKGQRCVIISSGQSALQFSSGSFDLLNALPNGEEVKSPLSAVSKLIEQSPSHPYAQLGADNFKRLAREAESFFSDISIHMRGDANENHYRITPMGILKPAWLTLSDFAVSSSDQVLPWKSVSIYNVSGFLDFYPQFIADEFARKGTVCEIHTFDLPDLDYLRRNPSELRSPNIARTLDKEANIEQLIHILKQNSVHSEAIVLPAVIGLHDSEKLTHIQNAVGKPIRLIPTMPPSAAGIRTQKLLHDYFIKTGGVYMLGDTVHKAELEGNKVLRLYSYNHGDIPFTAENFVLATGSYFSQGLIAEPDRVYEPVFDLDVSYLADRQQWYDEQMFNPQQFHEFGVVTNQSFNGIYKGSPIDNLYVSGAIMGGFNPIKEGSGGGVSILSALAIANSILNK